MNERTNARTHARTDGRTDERTNERTNDNFSTNQIVGWQRSNHHDEPVPKFWGSIWAFNVDRTWYEGFLQWGYPDFPL